MSGKIPILVVSICTAGAMVAGWSCGRTRQVEASTTTPAALPVSVVFVTRQDLSRNLEIPAEFRAYQEIDLYAKVAGYLKWIKVDIGSKVQRGEVLAELEVPEMDQDLAQASAALARAQSEVDRSRGEVVRAENAKQIRELSYNRLASVVKVRPNLVAQQEIDDAQAKMQDADGQVIAAKGALASAEEQVRVAEANKERIKTLIGYLKITAPFNGVITDRKADPGAMIQGGTASHSQALPVVRLSEIDRLRMVLPVPESIVGTVRLGEPVEVRVDALHRIYQGRVSRFANRLDSSTRTMEMQVDLPNQDGSLMPGMYGYATLGLERKNDVLALPVRAVNGDGRSGSVLVVTADNRIEERKVETGVQTADLVEIRSGLQEGARAVIGGRGQLKPGTLVDPKPLAGGGN
jgi:RND family efflux transporter MFP subunit